MQKNMRLKKGRKKGGNPPSKLGATGATEQCPHSLRPKHVHFSGSPKDDGLLHVVDLDADAWPNSLEKDNPNGLRASERNSLYHLKACRSTRNETMT